MRTLDNRMLTRTSDTLVHIYQFLEELSKIYNHELDLHS